jgi:hypothetical protein
MVVSKILMICLWSCFFAGAFAMCGALLSCCDPENENASAPNRGEGIENIRGTTLFA